MMIRTEPKAEVTFRSLAGLFVAIVGVSAATFVAASSSDTSHDIGVVLHRAQSEQTVRGFDSLLVTLGGKTHPVTAPAVRPIDKMAPANATAKPSAA